MKSDLAMKLLDPGLPDRLGRIRHVLFDFDGTLSVLREGWEGVMVPLMLEMISPEGARLDEIEPEVRAYVDRSTGILTIHQMEWLAEAVRSYGMSGQPLTAREYKAIYVERILAHVRGRVEALAAGTASRDAFMVAGTESFLARLRGRGVVLYLASGTDHPDVVNEAGILGLAGYFEGRIHGALDASEANDKGRIIERILAQNDLHGDELLVVGDGPVEMRVAVAQGAIALGVASDEVKRSGWNQRKIERLVAAGAYVLVPDFAQGLSLERFLFPEV
jgi:phosphoglycolate phosphatase-like HAD superfamily hydrolase